MKMSSSRHVVRAIGATLILGACSEPTQPPAASIPVDASPVSPSAAPNTALIALGANFGDATVPFLSSIEEQQSQLALRSVLDGLAKNLTKGDTASATRDIKKARGLLAELNGESAAVETAPIALALDNIEMTLRGETPGGEPGTTSDAP